MSQQKGLDVPAFLNWTFQDRDERFCVKTFGQSRALTCRTLWFKLQQLRSFFLYQEPPDYSNDQAPGRQETSLLAPTSGTDISPEQLTHSTRNTDKHPYLLALQIQVSSTHLGGVLRSRSLGQLVGSKMKHVSYSTCISWAAKSPETNTQGRNMEGKINDEATELPHPLKGASATEGRRHPPFWTELNVLVLGETTGLRWENRFKLR